MAPRYGTFLQRDDNCSFLLLHPFSLKNLLGYFTTLALSLSASASVSVSILHFDVFIGFIETLGPEDQSNDDDGRPPQNEEENGGGSIINIPA